MPLSSEDSPLQIMIVFYAETSYTPSHAEQRINSRRCTGLCRSKVLITASGGMRAKKQVPLKQIADKAVELAAKNGFQVIS